ncbi:auxin-induced in root cultures protein 12 [Herrania umbratica]|uniref:Auxin-induced in root cultures protein 12 n=1 Tax=Herrania umbratica TaxID=108875 RepID=A0A6J0ZG41_9ROSI|nr:auxin-induced in root cultures protein 12 [Herrania umbratica]
MESLFCPSLILLFSLWVALMSPAHSLNCSTLKLPGGKKQYSNCTELPTLNSTLHFTYDATNSSLSIAFSASPANPNGWIAWAINPTATGMAGSQALIAFKNNGSMVVKTYNISSYSSIVEGKLSFDVWDLEAGAGNDGKMVIYSSLKVPANAEKLNQVWQVGPGVSDGRPMKHEFAKANLASLGELKLVEKVSSGSSSPTPSPSPSPSRQVANNDSGDGSRVREMSAGLWILGLVSLLVLM